MPFSMPSYCLGVGTVVGALTLGFGGGVLLTKTAIKDTPNGPSRIERAARAEPAPAPAPQGTEARIIEPKAVEARAAAPHADPAPIQPAAASEPPQIQAAAEPAKPIAEPPKQEATRAAAAPAKPAEPARQIEAARQVEPAVRVEQKDAGTWVSERDQRRVEREQRRAERKMERERRYAERKSRMVGEVRVRQRSIEEQDRPARPELAFEREEPRATPFEGLFGRPADAASGDRD